MNSVSSDLHLDTSVGNRCGGSTWYLTEYSFLPPVVSLAVKFVELLICLSHLPGGVMA